MEEKNEENIFYTKSKLNHSKKILFFPTRQKLSTKPKKKKTKTHQQNPNQNKQTKKITLLTDLLVGYH